MSSQSTLSQSLCQHPLCQLTVHQHHLRHCLQPFPMSGHELVTQFTKDAYAQADRHCERSSCKVLIPKGGPCFYVATRDYSQSGRFVCAACYAWYQKKPATTMCVRNTQALSNYTSHTGLPNPQSICQSISAAQSRASINPPPVVAMMPGPSSGTSQFSSSMFLPPLSLQPRRYNMPAPPPQQQPHAVSQRSGPDVYVPSAWNLPSQPILPRAVPNQPSLPHGAVGYGAQHALYPAERERWARMAYCPPAVETISLDISAVYKGGPRKGRQRGTPIGSICEGRKDIDARITAPELVTIALDTIIPCIEAFCRQFPWRPREFVVHDVRWADLTKHPIPSQPYFYRECLQPSSRKNSKAMVFKTKLFSLFVVVPDSQWQDYQDFLEDLETRSTATSSQTPLPSKDTQAHALTTPSLATASQAVPSARNAPVTTTQTGHAPLFLPPMGHINQPLDTSSSFSSSLFERPLSSNISNLQTPHRLSIITVSPAVPLQTTPTTLHLQRSMLKSQIYAHPTARISKKHSSQVARRIWTLQNVSSIFFFFCLFS
ncbi:hypothetical protein PAXRUDRAFT_148509 [Paxillus rubicundulus Ve08.2h10]|uniref:Uncharacterized protein n=1 Tax=Paxillus rubicundulus Ve08.2h10 TaxID=930991 RepID=A0A0D0DTI4_9AGAM|nr:hypothetical protein PAXRUDRAFT_148509 [Paxillus rubicundulus Ve08.2h10]